MTNIRNTVTIALCLLTCTCFSQQLDRQVIASAGSNNAEFTIGEVVIKSNNLEITSGFQQPSFIEVPLSVRDISEELIVYPVPTNDLVNVSGDFNWEENVDIILYNIEGKQMTFTKQIMDKHIQINMADTPAGIYFLVLNDPVNSTFAKFKIKKIK